MAKMVPSDSAILVPAFMVMMGTINSSKARVVVVMTDATFTLVVAAVAAASAVALVAAAVLEDPEATPEEVEAGAAVITIRA